MTHGQPDMVYIEDIDYATRCSKGRLYGTCISGSGTLEVSTASFMIDL